MTVVRDQPVRRFRDEQHPSRRENLGSDSHDGLTFFERQMLEHRVHDNEIDGLVDPEAFRILYNVRNICRDKRDVIARGRGGAALGESDNVRI